MQNNYGRFPLFTTPLYVYNVPQTEALNHELADRLIAEEKASVGNTKSNVGGWHSTPDIATRSEPCFRAVVQLIVDHGLTVNDIAAAINQSPPAPMRYIAEAWARIMRDGDYTIVHDHGSAHWSVSYYVDSGDADLAAHPNSGVFAVLDPRRLSRTIPGIEDFTINTFTVRPRSGQLVIFPGYLQHYVHPYRGRSPRIAIACNVSMSPA